MAGVCVTGRGLIAAASARTTLTNGAVGLKMNGYSTRAYLPEMKIADAGNYKATNIGTEIANPELQTM